VSALSYACGPHEPVLEKTIAQAIAETVARFPDRDALIARHQNVRLTWREFDCEVERTARGLAGLGLAPLDRVGIWSGNCAEWVLLQMACARAGYVLVNVNPAYRSHDLSFVLRKSRMRALFLWESDARANYRTILEEAMAGQSLALEHIVLLGTDSWRRMLDHGTGLPAQSVSHHDPANIQYTSGTTGAPKGVLLTHRNLVNNAWLTGAWLGATEQDRISIPFPLYHCAGCVCGVLTAAVRGAASILQSAQFDARAVLEAIAAERATIVGGVPTMFMAELEHPEFARFDLSSLRAAYMGGAPCPVELLKRVNQRMHCREVIVIYGQTESSPVVIMSSPEDTTEQRVGTVGSALPNTEIKIVSPDGQTLPIGEPGELCARGYMVMKGYDAEPEATGRVIDGEGWLHTGDLAAMRPDRHFHITGRARDVIIRGGENIYPREIEEFLYTHPKVADVQVVGLPDRKRGEVVLAWIRLKAGEQATEEEVRGFCCGRIAHFKVPEHIRFVDAFPMTVTGKIQKFRIRQMEIEERGLAGEIVETA
jgi:fatty-acyl-CoA synthase